MKLENYLALQGALYSLGAEINTCTEMNENWTGNMDKDVASSIMYLLDVVSKILVDEKTPEIIKMMECDMNI